MTRHSKRKTNSIVISESFKEPTKKQKKNNTKNISTGKNSTMNNSINVELQEASNYDNFAINNHEIINSTGAENASEDLQNYIRNLNELEEPTLKDILKGIAVVMSTQINTLNEVTKINHKISGINTELSYNIIKPRSRPK
jgi:hypothetical protein